MNKTLEDLHNLASVLRKNGWEVVENDLGTPSFPWPSIMIKKPSIILPFFIWLQDKHLISTHRLNDPSIRTSINMVNNESHYTIDIY